MVTIVWCHESPYAVGVGRVGSKKLEDWFCCVQCDRNLYIFYIVYISNPLSEVIFIRIPVKFSTTFYSARMSADDTKSTETLKQLAFVPEYGSKGYQMASSAYENVKTRAPEPVKEQLSKVEQMTAPIVTKATDKGSEILKVVDSKVCYLIYCMNVGGWVLCFG